MEKYVILVVLSIMSGFMTGCAQNVSPHTYEACEAGVASEVISGVIIGKRAVKIDASGDMGGLAGAGVGGAAGSAIGGGRRANVAGVIGGAVIGGVVGRSVDKAINTHRAFEYIIRLQNGSTISIAQVQEMEFVVGQPVLIIYGAMTRIVPDNTITILEKVPKARR
jgi:outer membrane lipoprotein SlyB